MREHQAKKHLGQNFLIDPFVAERIITACALSPEDHVLEIGPGRGALTQGLIPKVKNFTAVETDRDLWTHLKEKFSQPHVTLVHDDILSFDISRLPGPVIVVGNLPYNISSPIIERIIDHRKNIRKMFFTVQLEFGQRLKAKPGGKDYSSLSCFAQYYADIRMLFKIPAGAFQPRPKVTSCFMELTPRPFKVQARDEAFLFRMIRTAFQQRRKTILNALSPVCGKERAGEALTRAGIEHKKRPEDLGLEDFLKLADDLA